MSPIHSALWEMVEAGGRTAQSFGLNRLLGQIFTLLYLSKEPLSLDSLASELGVSKASISIACRQLESWGAIKRFWVKGDRKDYYVAETDIGNFIRGGLLNSVNKKLESARIQIERSLRLIDEGGTNGEKVAFLRKRLVEAEGRRAKLAGLLNNPLLRKLL